MEPILIVDDEKDNLEALRRLLRNDYDVTLETSPFEALKRVQQQEFSVIVSDQRMPEMTGVELLEKVKQISPATTRILLTGYSDMDAVVGAINRGQIYQYVGKPWDPDDFKITLRQAAESYQLKREVEQKNRALSKSNEELKAALESLRVLDRAKARFLSLVSHELNTPLTVLTSFVQLLKDNKSSFPKDIQKAVSSLDSATGRFSQIIEEVLLYTKLESERSLSTEAFDLDEETRALAKELAKEFNAKKLSVALKAPSPAIIHCDREKMRQALERLFLNTIAFAPEGDKVRIHIEDKGKFYSFSISRGGPPLSEEAFVSLTSGSQNNLHHHKDLGLSLAICRFIVEIHGGTTELSDSGTAIILKLSKT
ncbi:MAG: hybrid sensor histidine kinase/response regulator [Bdellovibrionales bacterium]|nr:hybrid sensor histidine kinase/response regulator [Bdellovibrionales bacterium]